MPEVSSVSCGGPIRGSNCGVVHSATTSGMLLYPSVNVPFRPVARCGTLPSSAVVWSLVLFALLIARYSLTKLLKRLRPRTLLRPRNDIPSFKSYEIHLSTSLRTLPRKMCDYTQVEYACGHLRYTVRAWCKSQSTSPTLQIRSKADRTQV